MTLSETKSNKLKNSDKDLTKLKNKEMKKETESVNLSMKLSKTTL